MFKKILIANRGEIAIRIARTAADLGVQTAGIYASDDADALHVRRTDEAHDLCAAGAGAYLDIDRIVTIALAAGCDAVHPGYGFLSENGGFAARTCDAGLTFIGPSPGALRLFGDKVAARALAAEIGVPIARGTVGRTSLEEAEAFFAALGGSPMMIKAVAGGGGRGMSAVRDAAEVPESFRRCASEALKAFGDGGLYVERLLENVRHIEVQVIADRYGSVQDLGERECTLQRRNQKLVEIAPSPSLSEGLRTRLVKAAVAMARAGAYDNIGTFEFLTPADDPSEDAAFVFIEANARLQVEHTVTEEVTGVDLVAAQMELAHGRRLESLGLPPKEAPRRTGFAIQLRVNSETFDADGRVRPTSGVLSAFDMPSGPGVRVDASGYAGYRTNPAFDSLLAKLIVRSSSESFRDAAARAYRVASETRIAGVATNLPFLRALLSRDAVKDNEISTRFVDDAAADLATEAAGLHPDRPFKVIAAEVEARGPREAPPPGAVLAPLEGLVVSIDVFEGDAVFAGQQIAVLEAMKMEHVVTAPRGGVVGRITAEPGDRLMSADAILVLEGADVEGERQETRVIVDLDAVRPDLAEVQVRQAFTLDENRPDAVARRRKTGLRMARENIAALVDEGSFVEYGSLAIAPQRARRSLDDLIRNTPADGLVAGIASINAALVGPEAARAMVIAYDYTVLAGTQGGRNHKKQDRMFKLAQDLRLPVVLFAEGGGGRPGDTEGMGVTGLDVPTFAAFARLSGLTPLVGVVAGRCFAGNAALLGCCDVIIATKDSTLGMGGPAMIEGGGLGVYKPEEVGPSDVMASNGVIDILVEDEAEAVSAAARYICYFQGALSAYVEPDQRLLRHAIPENRLRVYDIRRVIEILADEGSVLELRRGFGVGIVTALIRVEGRPLGLLANDPRHLGGAIDADAGDKAARFVALCDAFDIPIVSLCDTPGFMVGPEAERAGTIRHVCRMFVTAASITVPYFTIVVRKGYGLGAQAMAGGGFHANTFTISWPSGEFGGMGFEGAVRLGFRREMEAIADPAEREAFFRRKVERMYETGKAINVASVLEIDQVIDPMETRRWIVRGLLAWPAPERRRGRKRPCIDTW